MGRVKEQIIREQEEDWVEENQKKWLNNKRRWSGFVYGDLINFDYLEDKKFKKLDIITHSGKLYTIRAEQITEANALFIQFTESIRLNGEPIGSQVKMIPLTSIESIAYIFYR